jgi:fumarylacetoacetate (FAA) hydrolase
MKLASLKGGRDGRLVVVSNDLQRWVPVGDGSTETLQAALDNWHEFRLVLEELGARANAGEGEPFDENACHSPLPRAFQWADGSAYVNHVELVRKARGAEMPESFWSDPPSAHATISPWATKPGASTSRPRSSS